MTQTPKKKVEAVLFTIGKHISLGEIKKLSGITEDNLLNQYLNELKEEYEKNDSSLRLIQDNEFWKMGVKEEYCDIVENIVSDTELSKSVMETLGVIAWKHPALQADVVHIRTNKAYDDIKQLEELGFISRSKSGRTKKINLTEKFFNYFDLPTHKKEKEVLKNLVPENIKNKIDEAEIEIHEGEKAVENHKIKSELQKQKQEQLKTFNDAEKEIHLAIESIKEERTE